LQFGFLGFVIDGHIEFVYNLLVLILVEDHFIQIGVIIFGCSIFVLSVDVGEYFFASFEGDFIEIVAGVVLGLAV